MSNAIDISGRTPQVREGILANIGDFNVVGENEVIDLSDRTPIVRYEILKSLGYCLGTTHVMREKLDKICHLNLSDRCIRELPEGIFDGLEKIVNVELDGNKLKV